MPVHALLSSELTTQLPLLNSDDRDRYYKIKLSCAAGRENYSAEGNLDWPIFIVIFTHNILHLAEPKYLKW